jgi:6-phosphogluconolactonase
MRIQRFDDSDGLYAQAAAHIDRAGAAAIAERGVFHLALSGGQTPLPAYLRLTSSMALDWGRIHVYWSDERCVPPSDMRSNYRAASDALLRHVTIPSENIHRIDGKMPPIDAAEAYEATLRRSLRDVGGRLDLVLLGIGSDGHTASLFPGDPALRERDRWVAAVNAPAEPPWRVTMTLPLINAAQDVLFLVTGGEKAEAVRAIIAGDPLPASFVRPTDGTAGLLVDTAAASFLP